jgi:hypothetical protein
VITTLFAFVLGVATTPGDKGPIALRIDGLAPVRVTMQAQMPAATPRDLEKSVTGLNNEEREALRDRLRQLAMAELEAAGFQVVDARTEGVPLFVVFAEARLLPSGKGDPVTVDTSVSVNEPAVWVRDPTRKGFIVVWSQPASTRVHQKDVSRTIESAVVKGVKAFTTVQSSAEQKNP